jgi:hypothetical protein
MSLADVPRGALSVGAFLRPATETVAEPSRGKCPFPHQKTDSFQAWLEGGLQCAAGKREFRLGRYQVSRVRTGGDYARAMAEFRGHVAEHGKTGFLAIFADGTRCDSVADELKVLGAIMRDAGMTDDADGLVAGKTLATAMEVACPVTGKDTIYEFFSVAFCRNAANPRDPLYDPSLSAPFLAVNTTSDAFAFARLVQDQAMRVWGRPVYEMKHDRDAVELLFRRCVTAWQNMSITTITNYSRVAVDPARGVHLSEDRRRWFAAHNDPVFAELKKCPFQHEMPITYAARLTAKWSANLFDGKPYEPSRDGQSGGTPIAGGGFEDGFEVEGLSGELFQF